MEEEEEEGMEGDVGKGSEKKENRIAYRTIVFFLPFFVADIMEESRHQLPFVMTMALLLYVHETGRAGINFKAPD